MRKFIVLLTFLFINSCYTTTYINQKKVPSPVTKSHWNHFFLLGLIGEAHIDVKSECPNGVYKIENKASFLNLLVSMLTAGIYTPHTVEIVCAGGNALNQKVINIGVLENGTPLYVTVTNNQKTKIKWINKKYK